MLNILFVCNTQVGIGEGVSPSAATDLIARQDIQKSMQFNNHMHFTTFLKQVVLKVSLCLQRRIHLLDFRN